MTNGEFTAKLPTTAERIYALVVDEPDPYVRRIIDAAQMLVAQNRGHFVYATSYLSGISLWRSGTETVMIRPQCEEGNG